MGDYIQNEINGDSNIFYNDIRRYNKKELITTSEISPYYWQGEPQINIIDKGTQDKAIHNKRTLDDLFCGAGGLSKGFEMTNKIAPILGVDIFKPAMETYRKNHPYTNTILGDMRKITNDEIIRGVSGHHVNIVAAGVPCQGFSISNRNRITNDERNFLFLEVIRVVKLLNPDVVVIENVSGMSSMENGQFISVITDYLKGSDNDIRYDVKCDFLNAVEFGVPQYRKRLFFVAVKKEYDEFAFPKGDYGEGRAYQFNTIRDAISDLPFIQSGESSTEYSEIVKTAYQQLMRGNQNKLLNHKAPKHPKETIKRISQTCPGEPMYEKYKQRIRLSWDIQSPTQLAGGIRPQFQFGHPEVARGLTIRERARIQSFPDDYEFLGGTVQGRVQTGNAVPPLLARGLGYSISELLDKQFTYNYLRVGGGYV